MNRKQNGPLGSLVIAMCIFGTVGILRRYIPLPSSLIALARGIVGSLYLWGSMLLRKQPLQKAAIRKNLPLLLLSGAAIGFNWIFLFEAYCYTSVATATLCYYLAPILVILLSPLVLKERLTLRSLLCALIALAGMIPVSGIWNSGFSGVGEYKGILFGLAAAALYASVILMNKQIRDIPATDKTLIQLVSASVVLLPYVLLTEDVMNCDYTPIAMILLAVAGIVHTGMSYRMYFGAISRLKAQTTALFSYIDPILAIILSAVILQEPLGLATVIGSIMILGAAYFSER